MAPARTPHTPRGTASTNADWDSLQDVRATTKKRYGKSQNTQGKTCKARSSGLEASDGLDTETLKLAFNETPNCASAKALELYLVDQCIVKTRKHQTGDKIHSAFNDLWRRAGFIGDYSYNKEKKTFKGNPAQQYEVKEIVKNIQKRDKEGGEAAKRNHAEAFLVEEVDAILAKSRAVCPDELVEMAIQGKLTRDQTGKCLEHAMMRVFFTMGFVLWTRNFELCQLRRQNFTWNCRKRTAPFSQFFTVFLENRKGWQNKSEYECSLESNTYEIHQCASSNEHAALDAYQAMTLWIRLYEFWIGRPLLPDELVFPVISVNGVIHTQEQLSQNAIQALITKFASAAGLTRNFTTHSLRRGGAQFRFMWDKVGRRWSLRKVRWWGGWAEGESVDTLMKYLLDSLSKYEENYSDVLDPGRADRGDVLLGEQKAHAPVTNETFNTFAVNLTTMFQQSYLSATQCSSFSHPTLPPQPSSHALFQPQLFHPAYQYPPPFNLPSLTNQVHTVLHPIANTISLVSATSPTSAASRRPAITPSSLSFALGPCLPTGHPPSVISIGRSDPILHVPAGSVHQHEIPPRESTFAVQRPPVPMDAETPAEKARRCAVIAGLPKGQPALAWRLAVKQWNEVDPATGYALKDWPESWYTGRQQTNMANNRRNRELVALAFARYNILMLYRFPSTAHGMHLRLNSDEKRFEEEYPECNKGFGGLWGEDCALAECWACCCLCDSSNGRLHGADSGQRWQRLPDNHDSGTTTKTGME
ncbi:hypothetical protein BDZ89DRAFT_1157278 [Hymenopellis radicata]|nr:hypothetical protein BDZ89DRAFT_1157278 [Hymenopellis radicata]